MEVNVEDVERWESIQAEVARHRGAMLPWGGDQPPRAFEVVSLSFATDEGREIVEVEGRAVHISDDGHVAWTFEEPAREAIAQASWPESGPVRRSSPLGDEGDHDLAAWKRYETLTKPDKMRLARYGNANERRLVMKDKDASLQLHVLQNPGLTPRELVTLLGGGVNALFVRRVTERAEWTANAAVAEALVAHPLTPLNVAVSLVARIPQTSARRIAKAGTLRAPIVAAARKRVITR